MNALSVKNLRKVYSTKLGRVNCEALKDISFEVERGEFVAIMGASGSGKTTLLNLIATLDSPTSGEVVIGGQNVSKVKSRDLSAFRRDQLGFVFQDFNLLDTFTLKDNILLPLVLSRKPIAEMERRLAPIASMLGITKLLGKYPWEVSGGEKQRAAVARAVITEPSLVLADEPTGALDSKASGLLLDYFDILHQMNRTILMVTHSATAASHAARVLFIRDGEIFSQVYRGSESRRAFYDRVTNNMAVMSEGGEQA